MAENKVAPFAAEVDEQTEFPQAAYDALRATDFHPPHIAETYGGVVQGADRSQLARILSLANMPLLTAPIFGPMLGGALLGHIGWRWLFFISAPLSMIALAISYWVMPSTQGSRLPGSTLPGSSTSPPRSRC